MCPPQPTAVVHIRLLRLTPSCCPILASLLVPACCPSFLTQNFSLFCLTSELFCPLGRLIAPVCSSVEWSHGTIRERWVVVLSSVALASPGLVFLTHTTWEWP